MQTSDSNGEWHSLHPTMLVLGLFNVVKGNIIPILAGGYAAAWGSRMWLLFFVGLLVFFPMVALGMRFASYRYRLGDGGITIREGLFSKRMRSIPIRRIHNINTSQSLPARFLGVVRLDIETAGGGAAEASMVSLSKAAAAAIQAYVRAEKLKESDGNTGSAEADTSGELASGDVTGRAASAMAVEKPSKVLYHMHLWDIFLAGATTNRLGVIFVAFAALFEYFQDKVGDQIKAWIKTIGDQTELIQRQGGPFAVIAVGITIALGLFLIAWIISIGTALIRWYNFTLTDSGTDLHIRTGLLTVREYTMPRNKLQALRVRISAFRRPFGLAQILVQSAGHVGMQDRGQHESDLMAPITKRARTAYFVDAVWPEADWDGVDWQKVHPYSRLRQFRILLLPLSGILVAMYFSGNVYGTLLPVQSIVAGLGLMAAWLIAHLTYRQTAYGHDNRFIYIKSGFIGLHFWAIPIARVQNLALTQTPFQRWRNLASLTIDVAGSGQRTAATIPNINLQKAWLLFNQFGHPRFTS